MGSEYYVSGHIEVEILPYSGTLAILQYSGTLAILQYSGSVPSVLVLQSRGLKQSCVGRPRRRIGKSSERVEEEMRRWGFWETGPPIRRRYPHITRELGWGSVLTGLA